MGIAGWIHSDPYKRRRAQMFTTGLTWAYISKRSFKFIKTEANLRPLNGEFDNVERVYGGNPSGHMTITTYMATFWALEKGKRLGIPLGLLTALAFSTNVACNHHYFSQAVAGTGLGMMMGYASHAAFRNITLPEDMSIGLSADHKGNLGVKFAYNF